jgi:hypothetical protein
MLEHPARPDPRQVEKHMAKAEPKYSAAAFRRLLAKLAAAKAEAHSAIEEQIKEVVELASPGFGGRFIDLFRKQWSSPDDAREYVYRRNLILVWLDDLVAEQRKRDIVERGQISAIRRANRDKQMAVDFNRKKNYQRALAILS